MHPLIKQMQSNGSLELLLVGIVTAVFAAPLFEEFVFRVLLQGWLERLEDVRETDEKLIKEFTESVQEK